MDDLTFEELGKALVLSALYDSSRQDSRLSRASWFHCWQEVLVERVLPRALAGRLF